MTITSFLQIVVLFKNNKLQIEEEVSDREDDDTARRAREREQVIKLNYR